MKKLLVVATAVAALLISSQPVEAATAKNHTEIVFVNTLSKRNPWSPMMVKTIEYMDALIPAYRFKFAKKCRNSRWTKCVTIYTRSLPRTRVAESQPLQPGNPQSDWTVKFNIHLAKKYTHRQHFRAIVHELGHVFHLIEHNGNPHNYMYYFVAPHRYTVSWTAAQLRHFRNYR